MKINVKGEIKEYKDGLSLKELIDIEKIENPEYVTVALNEDLLGASQLDGVTLKDGDKLEFLYFMGGGNR